MKVTLLDTQTGKTKVIESEFDEFWWSEGNGSCDCNRATFMGMADMTAESDNCLGHNRFLITQADSFTPATSFNENYPKDLLKKHGVLPPV